MQLRGFVRQDGRVGFRNHVLVLPLTGCEGEIARRIAEQVPGSTAFVHPNGCDLVGPDGDRMAKVLEQVATHPNVGGVLVLTMACAAMLRYKLPVAVKESGRLVQVMNSQQVGGTTLSVERGAVLAREMVAELAGQPRTPVPFASLVVGTKCGASDANSFAYCHPVTGRVCDLLVARGATIVLSEDGELAGDPGTLARRAAHPEIAARIRGMAKELDRMWKKRCGYTLKQAVRNDGITLAQWRTASRGNACKAGTGPITGFFEVGETVKGPGLVILNAPNTDLETVTCLAAAGCHLTIFTTGRGTPVGSPVSITVKVTATAATQARMSENIDVSVAGVADQSESLEHAAERLFDAIVAAANGTATKAETLRHWEVALAIRGVTF